MANSKISTLTNSLTKSTVATNDVLPIVDTGSTETKKITYQELIQPTDANFRIAGSSDSTKLVAFEVDGLTTATTRTLTVPDANTTLVGTDTTQTLTNKTLTSPQINFGSDANGDLIYRNGSGVTTRLAIGTTDQILAVQSGLPTWIANPSATAASSTVAGIVELATTAETTTGTDATRAVTPDGLHDMTSLAGAAWFLDEDTMTSDSATQTVSQQSVKAYVDDVFDYIPNTKATESSYLTYQIMPSTDTADDVTDGWVESGITITADQGGAGVLEMTAGADGQIYTKLPGVGSNTFLRFADIGANALRIKFRIKLGTVDTGERIGFGISSSATSFQVAESTFTDSTIRFVLVESSGDKLYAVNTNGSASTNTNVSGALTLTNWHTYEMVITSSSILFYIDGTLVATHSTNLPTTTGDIFIGFGKEYNAGSSTFMTLAPTIISMPLS